MLHSRTVHVLERLGISKVDPTARIVGKVPQKSGESLHDLGSKGSVVSPDRAGSGGEGLEFLRVGRGRSGHDVLESKLASASDDGFVLSPAQLGRKGVEVGLVLERVEGATVGVGFRKPGGDRLEVVREGLALGEGSEDRGVVGKFSGLRGNGGDLETRLE